LNSANLPTSPSFPNRLLFAAGGLGAGLALGLGIAAWLEVRDKAIRTETDVEAVMELSMLTSLPWVGKRDENQDDKKVGARSQSRGANKEPVEV